MESAFILGGSSSSTSSDGFEWANVADLDPLHAWDFLTDQAKFSGVNVGPLANTPGWSYTRSDAQTAYAQTSAGVLTPFATGVLRRTDKGVLIEGARTNRCLYARDMTNAAWTKTNATAALDQVGMDGVANSASSLTATAGNATCLQAITNASVARNYSFWVKRITGSGNIDITTDNGTTWATISGITTTGWVRGTVTQTLANPTVGVRIVTSGDAIAVDFCQEETGAFPSSPIPTTTASATRAADVLSVTGVSGVAYPLSLFAEFERAVDTATTEALFQVDDGSNNNRAILSINSSDLLRYQTSSGGVTDGDATVAGATVVGTVYKSAMRTTANDVRGARSGTLGTQDSATTAPAASPTTFQMGAVTGGSHCYGYLRRLALWTRALTDSELTAVTSG